jgi:hypothetical protein
MNDWVQTIIGLSLTLLAGMAVKPFLDCLRRRIVVPAISEDTEIAELWSQLQEHPTASGTWVGIFERIVLFGAVLAGSWEAVGVWLAFKLAAKWEAWDHMGFVPDDPAPGKNVAPLKWAAARRVWAAQGYATFVVGTAANLLLAAVGASIAECGANAACYLSLVGAAP